MENVNLEKEKKNKYIIVEKKRKEKMMGDNGVEVNKKDESYNDIVGNEVIMKIVGRNIKIVEDDYEDKEEG